MFPEIRMRRLRNHPVVRELVRETRLEIENLISPLFIKHGSNIKNPVLSMPGQYQLSLDNLASEVKEQAALGIKSVLLFGLPENKDEKGSYAYKDDGITQKAIPVIKNAAPNMLIIADVCFCEYTSHGHCGLITKNGDDFQLDNDQTLESLVLQSVSLAKAGADIIAPSGMIDGMVQAIRKGLDEAGYINIPILSYSVKYASALYASFREATDCAPQFGDRKTYQMDPANGRESLRECELDVAEGADMLMVKPAHAYLDVIYRVKQAYPEFPLGAYHTSAEYSMIKAAAANNWLNEKKVTLEILTAIKRAGADFIITYYAKEVANWLQNT